MSTLTSRYAHHWCQAFCLGTCLLLSACNPPSARQSSAPGDVAPASAAEVRVEGLLSVQMIDRGVGPDGQSRGVNVFSIDDGNTVYQLLKKVDTKYTNLETSNDSVLWQLGRRYRFIGSVATSLPADYEGTPIVSPDGKPLAFILASEVILLDETLKEP